ncbi:hypothetical protein M9Y10_014068 [Tritrichomonas musculus]|uniref:Serine-threonine/tyrosine-protein kinase catalytic domain-containing protein n=1 Tax=Tritrichomonas musculus TaxID=1915356 RepID=A0ABR2KYH3_9EUKA
MTKEKPFKEIGGSSQIISEIVINKNRPKINETVPFAYKTLIEKCWSQNPKERPTFDDIVYDLKTNKDYITNDINEEDYKKYVNFIETQIIEHKMKEETMKFEKEFIENDQKEDDISNKESKEIPKIISETDENMQSINEFISTKNAKELMIYLNKNCDNEMMSYVFDKCFEESMKFYISLCQEGILLNSAVAHHKYAISLIMDSNKIEPPNEINAEYQKSKYHLEKAIEGGFYLSYFSLARLYFEIYKDNDTAYKFAKKGSDKNDSYSKCLLGYFIAHGIGTRKHFMEGVSLILESKAENLIDQFATDIGIYYSKIKNIEGKAIDREREMFKWFE